MTTDYSLDSSTTSRPQWLRSLPTAVAVLFVLCFVLLFLGCCDAGFSADFGVTQKSAFFERFPVLFLLSLS